MNEPLMLTFDLGTQSIRGMLIDRQGNFRHMVQKKYEEPYFSKEPGWAEQKADFYFEVLCEVSKQLKEEAKDGYENVVGVVVTTMRDTTLCLDRDRKPLRDIIMWMDSREVKKAKPMKWWLKLALKIIGMDEVLTKQHKISAVNWIMENEPKIWEKTDKYVMLSTYLNYKLTGNLVDSKSNMIGHVPFDYKKGKWQSKNEPKRYMADIPEEKLCELIDAADEIGRITKETEELSGIPAGLPLIATGSDKGCETLGLSVIHEDRAALSFGTTATIQFATGKYFEPKRFLPSYPGVLKGIYNPEIQVYRGYWLISWFKKEFAAKECVEAKRTGREPEEILNESLRKIPAGCNGLILQPFWTPGVINPNAKGAVIGFSDVHNRIYIYRAIIEGIGFALMDGFYTMQKRSGQKIKELYVAGGGSRSSEICQITANMFGLPVNRIHTHEVSGLGAAIAGFVALGCFRDYDEAIEHMVHKKDCFFPDMKEHRMYLRLYHDIYKKIYGKLHPLYVKLKKIYHHAE